MSDEMLEAINRVRECLDRVNQLEEAPRIALVTEGFLLSIGWTPAEIDALMETAGK